MMRPVKKMGEEEKGPCQRELSHCVATELVPERHCGTTKHDRAGKWGPPSPSATAVLPSPILESLLPLQIASIINQAVSRF